MPILPSLRPTKGAVARHRAAGRGCGFRRRGRCGPKAAEAQIAIARVSHAARPVARITRRRSGRHQTPARGAGWRLLALLRHDIRHRHRHAAVDCNATIVPRIPSDPHSKSPKPRGASRPGLSVRRGAQSVGSLAVFPGLRSAKSPEPRAAVRRDQAGHAGAPLSKGRRFWVPGSPFGRPGMTAEIWRCGLDPAQGGAGQLAVEMRLTLE